MFITAHADETVRPRVLEPGAVECLFKPFSEAALLMRSMRSIPAAYRVAVRTRVRAR